VDPTVYRSRGHRRPTRAAWPPTHGSSPPAAALLASVTPVGQPAVTRWQLATELAADVRQREQRIAAVEACIKTAVAQSNTSLVQLFGMGPVLAATFLGEVSDVGRFPSKQSSDPRRQPRLRGAELLCRRPLTRGEDRADRRLRGRGVPADQLLPRSPVHPTRSALLTGRHAIRSGTHSVPIGAPGGRGLVAWEQTLGDLLSGGGYGCAAENTLVVFAGGEGNLRTPCLARWPGHIPPGRESDEIMHVVDWFTTILGAAGLDAPTDRVIGQFEASLRREPLIPTAAPLDHIPEPPTT
jgi:hypothetical protein